MYSILLLLLLLPFGVNINCVYHINCYISFFFFSCEYLFLDNVNGNPCWKKTLVVYNWNLWIQLQPRHCLQEVIDMCDYAAGLSEKLNLNASIRHEREFTHWYHCWNIYLVINIIFDPTAFTFEQSSHEIGISFSVPSKPWNNFV